MKKLLATLAFILFISPISVLAQTPEKATITVYVQTSMGEKVEDISVTVKSDSYNQTKSTDSQGKALFDNLNAGSYTATINLPQGSLYSLITGEQTSKSRTLQAGDEEEVFFGVKLNTLDEGDDQEETTEISIPSAFYKPGSTTTDLKDKSEEELKKVTNFTLHIPDKAKIVYSKALDLSSTEAIARLNKLDQYVFMDHIGEVTVATDIFPELNAPATVTLYGLNFVSLGADYTPVIVQDDQIAIDTVKNVILTGSNAISFEVTEFSTYAVKPTLIIENTNIETSEQNYLLKGRVDDTESEIVVYLNDIKLTEPILVNDQGEFTIPLNLEEDSNSVQVIAVGVSEQSDTETINIEYTPTQVTNNSSSDFDYTLIIAIILILVGLGTGIGYYLKRKGFSFRKLKKTTEIKKPRSEFDNRLLTPEEREKFNEIKDDSMTPKM